MDYNEKYIKYKTKYIELKKKLGGGTYNNNMSCSICMINYRWPFSKGDNPSIISPDTQNDIKLDNIMDMSKVIELQNCHHVFHRSCIDTWVNMLHSDAISKGIEHIVYTCPECRNEFIPNLHYIKVTWPEKVNQDYIKIQNERLITEYVPPKIKNNMNDFKENINIKY